MAVCGCDASLLGGGVVQWACDKKERPAALPAFRDRTRVASFLEAKTNPTQVLITRREIVAETLLRESPGSAADAQYNPGFPALVQSNFAGDRSGPERVTMVCVNSLKNHATIC
jgi:hypothetical protein